MGLIVTFGMIVVVSLAVLGLARLVEESGGLSGVLGKASEKARRVNPWHLLAGLAVVGLMFAAADHPPMLAVLGFAVVLVLFARAWVSEFLFLMDRRDDDFPGRSDKAVWAALMIALAPVGLWLFRSYRAARWPETVAPEKPAPAAQGPGAVSELF